jgi:gamma-tubulin complex component 5
MLPQLALGRPPSEGTVEIAKTYLDAITNPPPAPPTLTWADILAEEPFEGDHWEGVYGLPPGNVRSATQRENRDRDEWDSTPSLSPLNSDDLALDEDEDDSFSSADHSEPLSPKSISSPSVEPSTSSHAQAPYTYEHRKEFEELCSKQYWRDDWQTDAHLSPRFNIGDPSSLG